MKSISDEIAELQLTDEENELAILAAKEAKFYRIKNQEYAEKVRNNVDWSIPNARELFEGLRRTKSKSDKWFMITDWNKEVIYKLCGYFANNPKLEEQYPGMSLKKGICLTGPSGVGKTHLMNFFCKNPKASYLLATCRDVAEKFRNKWEYEGITTLEYYSSTPFAAHPQPYNQPMMGFCFGDLGTEEDKNDYGNKMNVIDEIFFKRYESGVPIHMTHFTTNLNAAEIKERYGVRFYDRLKETCNWIVLNGESFRE
jgi:DNA replication protein DnaC